MFGLQPTHIIIILVVALLIFGPSRLPDIGRALGKTLREFQSGVKEASQTMQQELENPAAKSAPVSAPCKQCGKPVQAGVKFCPECGAAQ